MDVRVVVPRTLTPRQQHLLEELAKEEGGEAQAKAQAQGSSGAEHDEGLLKKLWHTFTEHDHKPK